MTDTALAIRQTGAVESYGLVPTNMGDAMRLADMMATAKLVPVGLQKSPADCLMVIQQAVRWQMDPFAVAQECSVIQGKLMHSGKLVAAVVNARGKLAERLRFDYEGVGDNRTIKVSGRMEGETSPREVTVKLKDARTNNAMWVKQPDQQLMYHGSRVWARRHTPELMLGVYSPEEFEDAPRTTLPKKNARDIYTRLQAEIDKLESRADLERWETENADRLAIMPEDWAGILSLRIQERRLDLARTTVSAPVVTSTLDEMPEDGEVIWGEPEDATPPEWDSKWESLGPVKQAGILCNEPAFHKFLFETYQETITSADEAAAAVRHICMVKSRRDIATAPGSERLWRDLVVEYRAWQRDEIPSSPQRGDEAAKPASPESNTAQATAGEAGTMTIEDMAREAAERGEDVLKAYRKSLDAAGRARVDAIGAELRQLMPKVPA